MANVPLMFQPLARYADFRGRSRRSEFWLWVLFRIILGMVTATAIMWMLVPEIMALQNQNSLHEADHLFFVRLLPVIGLLQIVNLALLIPSIAVGVRRMHDINRSGWWIILPPVVAVIGISVFFLLFGASLFAYFSADAQTTDAETGAFVFRTLGSLILCVHLPVLVASVVLLVFYVTDGTPGPNRFGNDPKGRGMARPEAPMSIADAPEEMH